MKNLFWSILIAATACSTAFAQPPAPKPQENDSLGFVFTDVKVVKSTPVKNQAKSGTCWCFSGNSFLEDEILRITGKETDLSEMFIVYNCYVDKAIRNVRTNGYVHFDQGGSTLDNAYVWNKYGMVPEEVYQGLNYGEKLHNHSEVCNAMIAYVKEINKNPNRKLSTAWVNGLKGILNAYFGELPEKFTYQGKEYTPQTYAQSLGLNMDDYVPLTSFNHHEFYKPFGLEVADNWLWGQYQNVPLDEFKAIIDNAVENGYAVSWASDVSERGFKWKNGVAVIPAETNEEDLEGTELSRWVKLSDAEKQKQRFDIKGPGKEIEVTQESRQAMFDNQETTDDHGMVIEGYATDQTGKRYYKVKNSWGTDGHIYQGYFYVSEAYLMAKTMSILVHKDAIPKNIAKKLNLK